jgi:hypothetical protein
LTATIDEDSVRQTFQTRFRRVSVPEVKIDFEWSRAYSTRSGAAPYAIKSGKIVQIGERKQSYSPLKFGGLYLEFSRLDSTPEACLAFAEKYGLLCAPARLAARPSEELSFWRSEIKRMRLNIQSLPTAIVRVDFSPRGGMYARVGRMNVLLVAGPVGAPPVMVIEPEDLLQAMNLEMAHFVSGGGLLIPCRNCGLLFQAGRAGGKRTIAQFHNDECRNAFHNAKRSSK